MLEKIFCLYSTSPSLEV